MNDNATVNIPNDVLKPIIEAKIIEALGGEHRLLEELVRVVTNERVRHDYKEIPWIEYVCKEAIKTAAKEAVKSWVESHQEAMVAAVEREMSRKTKSVAKLLVESFAKRAASQYSVNVSIAGDE